MSEISDAVQIIRVAFDGVEVAMKVGSGSIEAMQKALTFIYGMLTYEKQMGKTNMKNLLLKGGDLHILQFAQEDMKQMQKLAKKYGILYSTLPKTKDGMCEVLFHSEATPRVQMMIQKMKSGRVTNMEDFLQNGNEEQLRKLMKFFEEQKKGNHDAHTDATLDNLIEKVGKYAMEKQSVSVEAIKENFQVEPEQAEEVVSQLRKIGLLEQTEEKGKYKVIVENRETVEKKINRFQELTTRMRTIAASKNTNLDDITIAKKMIAEENEHAIKTRIPGTWGENAKYIWINKSDIMEIHGGKTLLTFLDRQKDYKIYSEDNRVVSTMRGESLFAGHYDKVEKAVRERYTKALSEEAKTTLKTTVEMKKGR
jgi:uncharacterized protein YlbG (UPF0298 family)